MTAKNSKKYREAKRETHDWVARWVKKESSNDIKKIISASENEEARKKIKDFSKDIDK